MAETKSLLSGPNRLPKRNISEGPNIKGQIKEKQISYNGVSFVYKQNLAEEITPTIVKAPESFDPDFRPDGIEPTHLKFQFDGLYAEKHSDSSFHPEINVYPIKQYIRMFENSDYSAVLNDKLKDLKSVLNQEPSTIKGEHPFIPFVDATQIINSHLSYLQFREGKGMGFITQFRHSDPVLVNNKEIVYVFQGLTADEKFLISATFPLKTTLAAEDSESESHNGYKIPENYYKEREWNEENYKNYLLNVNKDFGDATDEQFAPNLSDIKRLLSSIEINSEAMRKNELDSSGKKTY